MGEGGEEYALGFIGLRGKSKVSATTASSKRKPEWVNFLRRPLLRSRFPAMENNHETGEE